MQILIKRVDKSLPLPQHEPGASCFDFVCRENAVINPKEIKLVPLNTVVKVPRGYTLLVFVRSSTPLKKGLTLANNVGIVDAFYNGDKDEIIAEFLNITDHVVKVTKGEMLVQGLFIKHIEVTWQEVDRMKDKGVGGYKADLVKPNKK